MDVNQPLVSVLFVTWNRCNYLLRAIASVMTQDYPCIEILVVDNASTDGTVDAVAKLFPITRVMRMHRNLGCPSARNIGVANCKGKYVYLMDDDGWFEDTSAISQCVTVTEQYPLLSVVCSRIHNVDDDTWYPNLSGDCIVSQFHGTCTLLRKDDFLAVGGFPDDFFFIGEEEFTSLRLLNSGSSIAVLSGSVLKHENRKTIGKPLGNFPYYSIRNTNRIALRLYPFPYSILRILKNAWHSLRFAVIAGQPSLPFRIFFHLMADIFTPAFPRTPVSQSTYRRYKSLSVSPGLCEYFKTESQNQ